MTEYIDTLPQSKTYVYLNILSNKQGINLHFPYTPHGVILIIYKPVFVKHRDF